MEDVVVEMEVLEVEMVVLVVENGGVFSREKNGSWIG